MLGKELRQRGEIVGPGVTITVIDAECGTVLCDNADKGGTSLYLMWTCGGDWDQASTNNCIEREELINGAHDRYTKVLKTGHRILTVRFPNKFDDGSGMDPRLSGQREESRKRNEWEAEQAEKNGVFYRYGQ